MGRARCKGTSESADERKKMKTTQEGAPVFLLSSLLSFSLLHLNRLQRVYN